MNTQYTNYNIQICQSKLFLWSRNHQMLKWEPRAYQFCDS